MTRTTILLVLMASLVCLAGCSTTKADPIVDQQLYNLLENKQFFKLRTELEKVKAKLSEDGLLYYEAFCDHVFDKCERSNQNIDALMSKYKAQLSDTAIAKLLDVKAVNSVRLYQYKNAAETYKQVLEEYRHTLDSAEIENHANSLQLWGTLAEVKPQRIHKHSDVEIASYRNQLNVLMLPVKCNSKEDEFVFDSGANLSTIMHSYAQKMGMKIYESDISVGTVTHTKVQTMLAVADSIYVGDLLFENVIFLVVPDEVLTFPSHNFKISGIIGFPVMHQMEEVHLRNDGSMYIPLNPQDKKLSNMCFDGLGPIVQMIAGVDTLSLSFDTGAVRTELSKQYFDSHKEDIEANGALVKSHRGGAGGIVEVKEYEIENFSFVIGSKSGNLGKVSINVEDFDFLKKSDGNLGQDIISQFDEMILNFTHMYLDFS